MGPAIVIKLEVLFADRFFIVFIILYRIIRIAFERTILGLLQCFLAISREKKKSDAEPLLCLMVAAKQKKSWRFFCEKF